MHRIKEIDMQSIQKKAPLANNHISVDCVVIGFDGEQLKVLLVKRAGEDKDVYKRQLVYKIEPHGEIEF